LGEKTPRDSACHSCQSCRLRGSCRSLASSRLRVKILVDSALPTPGPGIEKTRFHVKFVNFVHFARAPARRDRDSDDGQFASP